MKKIFSGFTLKIIGIIFMVIDHINSYLGNFLQLPLWIALLGRFVAPLFVFLMVEGFFYTRSKKKYFLRMFIGGIAMYGINIIHNLLTKSNFDNPFTKQFDIYLLLDGQNIFITLAFLFAFLWILDNLRKKVFSNIQIIGAILGLIFLLPCILFSEGGPYELIIALIFYLFSGNLKKITVGISLFSLILLINTLYNYLSFDNIISLYQELTFNNEFMIITVLPFIYLYNGKRGGNGAKWQKNLFYYFYPIHLIIIYLLQDIMAGIL
jgi:hypothetical protein